MRAFPNVASPDNAPHHICWETQKAPAYPDRSRARAQRPGNLSEYGFALAQFDVSADGKAENIEIVRAFPENKFDRNVQSALRRWRAKPVVGADGQPSRIVDHMAMFTFIMED